MHISVDANGSVGVTGGKPSLGVSLGITSTIQEKQWQLYNSVTYNW